MSDEPQAVPKIATAEETEELLQALKSVDASGMLDSVVGMPTQISQALETARAHHTGDIPLDHSCAHLVGLGGSAIAGELIEDMTAPKNNLFIHRGTMPPADRCGVVVSSYSGNTTEILEIAPRVVGGLKSVVFLTSGGRLAQLGRNLGAPVWLLPPNYQPRAAVGWSLGYLGSLYEQWRILNYFAPRLERAATRLATSITKMGVPQHPLVRAALPIARALQGKQGIVFHSIRCQGAAYRLSAQIAENGKQTCFHVMLPEAMHNLVEGLCTRDPNEWAMLFISDPNDPPSLKAAIERLNARFTELGFACMSMPYTGDDQFEVTLARVMMADFVSLFLAALQGIDPTPIETISGLKLPHSEDEEPYEGEADSIINHYATGER